MKKDKTNYDFMTESPLNEDEKQDEPIKSNYRKRFESIHIIDINFVLGFFTGAFFTIALFEFLLLMGLITI